MSTYNKSVNSNYLCTIATVAITDTLIFHPIDALANFQQYAKSQYRGLFSYWREQGLLGIYRGLTMPLLTSVPGRLMMYVPYRYTQNYLSKNYSYTTASILAGAVSGIGYSLTNTPAEYYRAAKANGLRLNLHSSYRGLLIVAVRTAIYNMLAIGSSDAILASTHLKQYALFCAMVSMATSASAAALMTPLDVVKTNYMLDSSRGFWKQAQRCLNKGLLTRSLFARVIRVGSSHAFAYSAIRYVENSSEKSTSLCLG